MEPQKRPSDPNESSKETPTPPSYDGLGQTGIDPEEYDRLCRLHGTGLLSDDEEDDYAFWRRIINPYS